MGKPYSMDLRERVVAAVELEACPAIRRRPIRRRGQHGNYLGAALA
jgi:hypothetical protein